MTTTSDPYAVLGLAANASRHEVKDSFRKLCLEFHPDRCKPELKPVAEAKFRRIKDAYDAILRGQAGYSPPAPGSAPTASAAKAWSTAHAHRSWEDEFLHKREGRMMNGPFGGFATEYQFYKSMFKNANNSPMVLMLVGMLTIPVISLTVGGLTGKLTFFQRMKEEGISMFSDNRWIVNGHVTNNNPFVIRDHRDRSSYIYKTDKYQHLREHSSKPSDNAAPDAAAAPPNA